MPATSGVTDAIGRLLSSLLATLDRVGWVQRHLHPALAPRLADELAPAAAALAESAGGAGSAAWPEDLKFVRDRLLDVARQTVGIASDFGAAARSPGNPIGLYRALRRFARAQEALYPLAPMFEPVSRWFLEPGRRGDDALVARLRQGTLRDDGVKVGPMHAANERDARGGFSLYVPETWHGRAAMPLVVALHGGHGHGRDFLWTWLREARAREVLLLAPTSRGRTWSIMGGDDVDAARLHEMVAFVAGRYPVDRGRLLLTGMSDGATYALMCGLREDTPFTHLAPASGVLHPLLLATGAIARARGRPIYLVHGALDWMFPVHTARMASEALRAAGAQLVYREIADLSHTYARDEHPSILDWLQGT